MINTIDEGTKKLINDNSVVTLPNRPHITAEELKQRFVKPITDTGNSLISEVNRIVGEANADITAEAEAREEADTTNAGAIEQETTDRTNADGTLQANIDKEISDRGTAITAHNASNEAHSDIRQAISDETTNRTSAISAEATARGNANTTLQNNINAKVDKEAGKELIPTTELTRLGTLANYDDTTLSGRVTTVENALPNKADLVDGKVPATQIPGSYDDVIEGYLHNNGFYFDAGYQTLLTAYTGKLYVDLLTNLVYRYSGSAYVATNPQLALGETSATAYRGDRGKIAYDFSQSHTNPTKVSQLENDSGFTSLTIGTLSTQAGRGDLTQTAYQFSQNHTNPTKTSDLQNDSGFITSGDIPAIPTVGTLNSSNTTAQATNASESLGGSINLHKVSKTGSYNDLLNKPTIPTVPTISTNITTDATSDTKTASPKAVKTFVEAKGYGIPTSQTITIATTDWSNKTCTKSATYVTATNIVMINPASASFANFANAEIRATSQGASSLTFTCTTTPTSNIDVVVVTLN